MALVKPPDLLIRTPGLLPLCSRGSLNLSVAYVPHSLRAPWFTRKNPEVCPYPLTCGQLTKGLTAVKLYHSFRFEHGCWQLHYQFLCRLFPMLKCTLAYNVLYCVAKEDGTLVHLLLESKYNQFIPRKLVQVLGTELPSHCLQWSVLHLYLTCTLLSCIMPGIAVKATDCQAVLFIGSIEAMPSLTWEWPHVLQ